MRTPAHANLGITGINMRFPPRNKLDIQAAIKEGEAGYRSYFLLLLMK